MCYSVPTWQLLRNSFSFTATPLFRYRAKVEKVDGGNVHVLYIDFGNVSVNYSLGHLINYCPVLMCVFFHLFFHFVFSGKLCLQPKSPLYLLGIVGKRLLCCSYMYIGEKGGRRERERERGREREGKREIERVTSLLAHLCILHYCIN